MVKQLMQTKIYVTKIKLVKHPKFPDPIHHTAAQTVELVQWREAGSMPMKDGNSGKVGRTQSNSI